MHIYGTFVSLIWLAIIILTIYASFWLSKKIFNSSVSVKCGSIVTAFWVLWLIGGSVFLFGFSLPGWDINLVVAVITFFICYRKFK